MGNGLRLELVQSTARSFCAEERQACWRARRRASGSPSHNRHRAGHYRRRHPSPVSPVRNRESSRRRRTESLDRAPSIDRTGLRRASAAGCTILFSRACRSHAASDRPRQRSLPAARPPAQSGVAGPLPGYSCALRVREMWRDYYMAGPLAIGTDAPDFEALTTEGSIHFMNGLAARGVCCSRTRKISRRSAPRNWATWRASGPSSTGVASRSSA